MASPVYPPKRRRVVNAVMLTLTGLCTLLVVSVLFFILGYLAWHGARSLNWDFFTKLPAPVGQEGGGMANALVGSLKMLLIASAIGIPIGMLAGIYLAEFGRGWLSGLVRYMTDLLNGVPSIVMGIFVYTLVVLPMRHFSTLAGGIALGIMMIPIALRSTEEFLRGVPNSMRESGLALGASKAQTVFTVIVPAAITGIVTGIMLNLARVAGETAPLLFTAFGNQFWSKGVNEPTASLPVMIFNYAISPYEDWHRQAWAAGFVLLMAVLAINIVARVILQRGRRVGR
ncbi:phosphate ABC transporter permease PstA [Terriglobus roseus]|uniref:Phosphate transport system permease protein PstA n=1 Tax=Terriglobus roseus TaxID=392734 RepID=A0A1G7G080_9BACT|nr:phosphate ABC transporter permease PstA [Terriglobus roseus]SDE81460.1 phosphate ABC transporter membrane protein 2, PhoT family [Terriglobus roseus]